MLPGFSRSSFPTCCTSSLWVWPNRRRSASKACAAFIALSWDDSPEGEGTDIIYAEPLDPNYVPEWPEEDLSENVSLPQNGLITEDIYRKMEVSIRVDYDKTVKQLEQA